MPAILHRVVVCLTTLLVIQPPAFPVTGLSGLTQPVAIEFDREALAPAAASPVHSFDPVRITFVRLIEPVPLPRSTGAGETSIHRAFREVERMLRVGEFRQALVLSEVLAEDLAIVLRTGSIEPMMKIWDARFPSDLRVDIIESDLRQFEAAFDRLLAIPEYRAAQTKTDAFFMECFWQGRFGDSESPALWRGFETPMDLLESLAYALELEATFKVKIPGVVRKLLRKHSPLSVAVRGLRTVPWIMAALEGRYPSLANIDWHLRIDGKIANDSEKIIDPTQSLSVILQRSRKSPVSTAA